MPPGAIRLSKSRVMAGLQCHKRLWWTVHEPAAPELTPDNVLQHRFDVGIRIGIVARAYVPGGVLIDLPYRAYDERITATEAALQGGAPVIYEAAFRAGQVFVSVDILEHPSARAGVIEVKSSNSVKEEHVPDVAVQAHVVRRSGVGASRLEIMHLNKACAYPDLSNLFTRSDVTEQAHEALEAMPAVIQGQLAMLAGPLPDVAIGDHCTKPYECPFMARCWPVLPPHHVSTLYRGGARARELEEQGYATLHDLPEDIELKAIQGRQRRAVQSGQLIVDSTLAAALRIFQPPLAYLDFETVGLPIPIWNGCHPWEPVPVQFSCHVEEAGGRVTHHEWLADGPGDPRPALAERLIRACEPARSVVVYNASFERRCLLQMADALPALAGPLRRIADGLVDLLPLVRNHVYHPDFGGSFSLKSVLPAMVPELRYDTLAIGDGETASLELEHLLFQEADLTPEVKAHLRGDLLRYCGQDTWGLVKLLERLRHLARR
ncbi:MAG TPA: DUF2779 domain-containing protein [Methylomirabilota bacterium]|nr:DUF2779 domain-containing protein [Methylomirabilota bacterium]